MLELRRRDDDDPIPIELDGIAPVDLAGLSLGAIERLPILYGNRTCPLAEHFQVHGDPADATLYLQGNCARVKGIGREMEGGCIVVDGPAGMHVAAEMRSGVVEVRGNAGDDAGAHLRGGLLRISGDAGAGLGGAYRGERRGMSGGMILVAGNVGQEAGGVMRRGTIAIAGSAGDFAAVGMLAGTLLVGGELGERAGAGMRRGTIVCAGPPPVLLPTFRRACRYRPPFLPLLFRHLRTLDFPLALNDCDWDRYSGDLLEGGRGEVLLRASD